MTDSYTLKKIFLKKEYNVALDEALYVHGLPKKAAINFALAVNEVPLTVLINDNTGDVIVKELNGVPLERDVRI